MNRFADLLDRLAYEPSRNNKLRLLEHHFRTQPDPDRGYALAAMTGGLAFAHAKPALVRGLIAERTDPVLFAMSYDYVGDLSETVALMWPRSGIGPGHNQPPPPTLSEIVGTLQTTGKVELPARLAACLDVLDEKGRWALLKLITGALRIGVSARLAKTAVAALGGRKPDEIEELWHGLVPPYTELFAWLDGRGPRPESDNPAPFRPPMLAQAIEAADLAGLDPAAFRAEWKWDGIRVQAVSATDRDGRRVVRLYSRTGEDTSAAFPDMIDALYGRDGGDFALDGELLVVRDGRVQPFAVLQQRLNRKSVTARLTADFPLHIRAYDLLWDAGEDLRALGFDDRRARLERVVSRASLSCLDLSPLVPFDDWPTLEAARQDPGRFGGDAAAIEGVMIKRRDAPYVPGRPRGLWWKWKRDPYNVDAVLMYAQRGHGKRSSLYSDFTFGLWRVRDGIEELVPVGKAYFGFTDAELAHLDRWVRHNTLNRFGPVRELKAGKTEGLVLEIAFEGLNRSTRHKSGVAMRFPRIARIRWDKPPHEADRLETLERMLR